MHTLDIKLIAVAAAMTFGAGAMAQTNSTEANPAVTERPAASAPERESAGAYVDDAVITTKIKAVILGEASLKSAEIKVETYKGVVQLTGFVGSPSNIEMAVAIARGTKGVTSVKNDMIVKGQQ